MILLKLNESSASNRVVPLPPLLQGSATTSAATNESGRTFYFSIGGVDYGSGGSLSVISAAMGLYACCFSASRISVTGPGFVYYGLPNSSLTALQATAPFMVVPFDSYDSMRLGLFALPNAAAEAAGGLPTLGTGTGQLSVSNGSVGLKAQTHSQATVGGADNLGRREYSDITMRIGLVDYSGASVGARDITPRNYSGVSVEVKTGGIQVASVGAGSYSGVSVEVKTGGIQTTSVGVGNYSGVSVEVKSSGIVAGSLAAGAITSAKFAAGAVDAAALATDASQEIADTLLGRNIAGGSSTGRIVSEALYPLRNRILIVGSVGTVYQVDDSTSAWTFSPSLGTAPLSGIDPVGP